MNGIHFSFDTSSFIDNDAVRSQNINEIGGHDLGVWLTELLSAAGFDTPGLIDEDFGYSASVSAGTSNYSCTFSMDHDGAPPYEAHVTVNKTRSLFDRIRGTNKYEKDDPVGAVIDNALRSSSDVANLKSEIT